ncbi:Recombining binding protein suppressor of hairless-like protein [Frankliniella fusca]|uniref:Recombining binding protein suppressor of hairless-like protein n=1 Tax=Frankliniella fusca TaxID=407009 RepID=A0AAE1GTU0_9NEOP|nr:Recombining binding protein suppressor of hairless-like protein [Frankliniella fusca]
MRNTLWSAGHELIFSCSLISFDKVYFTLKILCFPPYTVGKAKTSMSSSKVRDKGMLPSPGAILTPESATKPLVNKVSCWSIKSSISSACSFESSVLLVEIESFAVLLVSS